MKHFGINLCEDAEELHGVVYASNSLCLHYPRCHAGRWIQK